MKTPKTGSTRLILPRGVSGQEPANADAGTLSFDDATDKARIKLSTGWTDLGTGGGGGVTSITTNAPLSENASTGAVTLSMDLHAQTTKGTPVGADEILIADSAASFAPKRATLTSIGGLFTAGVSSFNGRTGVVVPVSGDYTPTQVGLGNVTNDAQLKRSANDYLSFAAKAIPGAADEILIEDASAGGTKKATTVAGLISAILPGGSYPLWTTPATLGRSPGTIDTEFDSTTIPAALVFWDANAGVLRTPASTTSMLGATVAPPNNSVWADAHTTNTGRPSWLRVQVPTATNNIYYVAQPFTLASNTVYWTRFMMQHNSQDANGNTRCYFAMFADLSGHPDGNNRLIVGYDSTAQPANYWIKAGAQQTGSGVSGPAISVNQLMPEYFGIWVDGSTSPVSYNTFMALADGNTIISMQRFTSPSGFSPAWIGWEMRGGTSSPASFAPQRYAFDFVRQSATFPW